MKRAAQYLCRISFICIGVMFLCGGQVAAAETSTPLVETDLEVASGLQVIHKVMRTGEVGSIDHDWSSRMPILSHGENQPTQLDGSEVCCDFSNDGSCGFPGIQAYEAGESVTVNTYWTEEILEPQIGYTVDWTAGLRTPGGGIVTLFEDEPIDFGDILDPGTYTFCSAFILELPDACAGGVSLTHGHGVTTPGGSFPPGPSDPGSDEDTFICGDNTPIEIDSFEPTSGGTGTEITVAGSGFFDPEDHCMQLIDETGEVLAIVTPQSGSATELVGEVQTIVDGATEGFLRITPGQGSFSPIVGGLEGTVHSWFWLTGLGETISIEPFQITTSDDSEICADAEINPLGDVVLTFEDTADMGCPLGTRVHYAIDIAAEGPDLWFWEQSLDLTATGDLDLTTCLGQVCSAARSGFDSVNVEIDCFVSVNGTTGMVTIERDDGVPFEDIYGNFCFDTP